MPTVIDSFVVSLGLDAKGFTQGQKDAAKALTDMERQSVKTGQQIEKAGKASVAAFSSLKRELFAVIGLLVAGAGVKSFIGGMLDMTASVERMSTNFALNKRSIFEWRVAAEQAGGTAEEATAAISKANDEFARFHKYREVSQGVLVNGVDISGASDGLDLLLKKSEAIARVRNNVLNKGGSQGQAEAAGNLATSELGIALSLYPILKDGPEGAKKLLQANKALVDQELKLAADSESLRKEWNKVTNSLSAAGLSVLNHFMPAIKKFADYLLTPEFQTDLDKLTQGAADVGDALVWLARKLKWVIGDSSPTGDTPRVKGKNGYTYKDGVIDKNDPNNYVGGTTATGHTLNDANPEYQQALRVQGYENATNLNEKKLRITNKLKAMGYTTDQARAIAGNLQAESGLDTGAYNPRGGGQGARGLGQWRGARQDAFKKMFGHGVEGSTEDEQLKFLKYKLDTNLRYKNALSGSSVGAMTESFARIYEAPSAAELSSSLKKRLGYAGALGANATAVGKSASNSSSTTVNIDSVNIKTAATDAPGIAGTIKPAIQVAMATTGVQ